MPAAILAAAVYVAGVPLGVLFVLHHHRARLGESGPTLMFSHLYARFARDKYFWEVVILGRSFFLVLALVMLDSNVPLQALAASTVLLAAVAAQTICRPYASALLNWLEASLARGGRSTGGGGMERVLRLCANRARLAHLHSTVWDGIRAIF
jgi:hypothetical protein